MIQRGDGAGFPIEALAELLGADLDGDYSVEPRIAGFVHFPHAAGADGREDLTGTESKPVGKWHKAFIILSHPYSRLFVFIRGPIGSCAIGAPALLLVLKETNRATNEHE